MIHTKNLEQNYLTEFTDGPHVSTADAPKAKGGGDLGFTPFALLEASLSTCLNITLRVYAQSHDIALGDVETTVTLVPGDKSTTFEYAVKFSEAVTENQKKRLLAALRGCPIHSILSNPVEFKLTEA